MGGKKEIYQYIRFFHGALQLQVFCRITGFMSNFRPPKTSADMRRA